MTVSGDPAPNEELGRSVFSTRHVKRARRGRIPVNAFLIQEGHTKISVDRLTIAPEKKAVSIAEKRAAARGHEFHGWAAVTAEDAGMSNRRVAATPQLYNSYHADIILPGLAAEDREEQKRHAQELADASGWRERPDRM